MRINSPSRGFSRPVTALGAAALAMLAFGGLAGCAADDAKPAAAATEPLSTYAAIAKGRIDVEGGTIRLAAQREGLIREVRVEEGADSDALRRLIPR